MLHLLCVSLGCKKLWIIIPLEMTKRNLRTAIFVDPTKNWMRTNRFSCNYLPFADGNGKSAGTNGHSVATGAEDEKERFLNGNQPVRLTPAWEENNLTNDELNMKSMTMDRVKMELDPPKDRYRLIFLTLVLHGLGTLIPWNMFITAKSVNYWDSVNFYSLGWYKILLFSVLCGLQTRRGVHWLEIELCGEFPRLFGICGSDSECALQLVKHLHWSRVSGWDKSENNGARLKSVNGGTDCYEIWEDVKCGPQRMW